MEEINLKYLPRDHGNLDLVGCFFLIVVSIVMRIAVFMRGNFPKMNVNRKMAPSPTSTMDVALHIIEVKNVGFGKNANEDTERGAQAQY